MADADRDTVADMVEVPSRDLGRVIRGLVEIEYCLAAIKTEAVWALVHREDPNFRPRRHISNMSDLLAGMIVGLGLRAEGPAGETAGKE